MISYKTLRQLSAADIPRIESPEFLKKDSKYESLKNGRLFAVQSVSAAKPLFIQGSVANIRKTYGSFELHNAIRQLKGKAGTLGGSGGSGGTGIVRQEAKESGPAEKKEKPKKKEKVIHRVQLEIEPDEGAALPESHDINLVVINTSANAVALKQSKDVIRDLDSRTFKLEEGESFDVYAVLKDDKESNQDLKTNGNLDNSVSEERLEALELSAGGEGADGAQIHYAKYVVPDFKEFVFSC